MRNILVFMVIAIIGCADDHETMAPVTSEPSLVDSSAGAVDNRGLIGARSALSGGATTVFDASLDAFSFPAPNLQALNQVRHEAGDVAFEAEFGEDPTGPNPGLGSVFDNISCESCHLGDGRGRPPVGAEPFSSMLFRASVAGKGPHGSPSPVPGFGTQLQMQATTGITPEIQAAVSYVESLGVFSDGTPYTLQVPHYTLAGLYRPLPVQYLFSPRAAPAVFGLGLLEAVPEIEVLLRADPTDRNRDGISGRPNYVWDEVHQRVALGRFGWKANNPSLLQQTAGAYNGDMGVTSQIFPAESCAGQYPECITHPPEVDSMTVANVAAYTQTLGVPARRNLSDPTVLQGERLFYSSGCNGCHTPTLVTGNLPGVPEVSGQIIHPYTDLLIHDMGPALADGRPDFQATGSEWRTAPLWGIGLVQTVNGHTRFMHDGRATSLLEAILWHGGEGKNASDRVRRMKMSDRQALIVFLESL
ncbi:MAG: di-heme oxidoredictase family protein [Gemmatimonadota bacterium]